jgi:peptidoglycan-N-acetylglucosamine deacetylase
VRRCRRLMQAEPRLKTPSFQRAAIRSVRLRPVIAIVALASMVTSRARAQGGPGPAARPAVLVPRPPSPIEVALTVDDLPRHGSQIAGKEPAAVARVLLAAFARHGLHQVYGFVNAERLTSHPEDREVLRAWVAAGHPLGNHTWSHPDLDRVPVADFLQEIDRDEAPLAEAMAAVQGRPLATTRPPAWKVFRYPFLREGKDAATRAAVRAHLAARGYRIAHVTVDPYDWAYNDEYVRCLGAASDGAHAERRALAETFVAEARAKLQWSVTASAALAGRPVRQILLIHLGAIDADTIEPLLAAYEGMGVRWITLDEALADPIYGQDVPGSTGGAFLRQLFRARGAAPPPITLPPRPPANAACAHPGPAVGSAPAGR